MKKYFVFLLIFAAAFFSCQKTAVKNNTDSNDLSLTDAVVTVEGSFVFYSEKNLGGVAKIYRQKSGKYLLGLEQMSLKGIVDFEIYFSKTATLSAGSIKLFSVKSIEGKMYYELPAGINPSDYPFVVIHNDIDQQAVAAAELK